ncbi:MAG TPA: hypothetical protein VG125_28570 [Pirellulales bacterium]|jgi:hypothetical protein|nr:hypothetical protein [Pirellulales bacterium]
MKYSAFCVLTAMLALSGCDAARNDSRPAAQPAPPTEASSAVEDPVGQAGTDDTPTDEAPRTPGGAIYGEVVAATDEIVGAIDAAVADPAGAASGLHRAVLRFQAAARNWTLYAANMGGAELAVLQESRLAQHAEASEEKLRESILRAARDPAAGSLQNELRNLLQVWREALSPAERAELERWIAENELL